MRELKVKRTKKLTACAMSVKLYVTDGEVCDSVINGQSCRLLGTLASGEEKTFYITEDECALYAIADELSKNFCVDMYKLPASSEPVSLSGHNVYSPMMGNPFRFDNNDGEEAKAFRAESKKKRPKALVIVPIIVAVSMVVFMIGGAVLTGLINRERPQTFKIADASITLTNKFRAEEQTETDYFLNNYYLYISSSSVICELFLADPTGIKTVDDLENYYKTEFDLNDVKRYNRDGLTYFTCTEENDDGYQLFDAVFMFEKNNTVHAVWFTTGSENANKYMPKFIEWAKTTVIE